MMFADCNFEVEYVCEGASLTIDGEKMLSRWMTERIPGEGMDVGRS